MKLLLDSCVWYGVPEALRIAGYDLIWVGEWDYDPGDREILSIAYQENRILITLDKDFGELAIVQGASHKGILRIVDAITMQQSQVCLEVLPRYREDLIAGAIITAGLGRVRIRSKD
jgi:predicted nuclease of predicted toxin-antitoxin system